LAKIFPQLAITELPPPYWKYQIKSLKHDAQNILGLKDPNIAINHYLKQLFL
jgi:hypothetical protein